MARPKRNPRAGAELALGDDFDNQAAQADADDFDAQSDEDREREARKRAAIAKRLAAQPSEKMKKTERLAAFDKLKRAFPYPATFTTIDALEVAPELGTSANANGILRAAAREKTGPRARNKLTELVKLDRGLFQFPETALPPGSVGVPGSTPSARTIGYASAAAPGAAGEIERLKQFTGNAAPAEPLTKGTFVMPKPECRKLVLGEDLGMYGPNSPVCRVVARYEGDQKQITAEPDIDVVWFNPAGQLELKSLPAWMFVRIENPAA